VTEFDELTRPDGAATELTALPELLGDRTRVDARARHDVITYTRPKPIVSEEEPTALRPKPCSELPETKLTRIAPPTRNEESAPAHTSENTPILVPPQPTPPPRRSRRPIVLAAAALLVSALALSWAFGGESHAARAPGVAPAVDAAPTDDAPDELPALERTPSLAEAADLVVTARYAEAARAYAALAREHPDRPELGTMARILREKAAR
jgi:hypothetical protein